MNPYATITFTLRCKTRLHIGGSKETMEIGGSDNPVLKSSASGMPYVPGSSLKGKIRSLLEVKYKKFTERGGPCDCGRDDCFVCVMFGCGNAKNTRSPSRLIFRDAYLKTDPDGNLSHSNRAIAQRVPSFTDEKHELVMDRRRGTAAQAGPRPMEGVPEGTEFACEIVLRTFDGDTDEKVNEYKARLKEGFDLLQKDYLGGSGTRGYGKVEITDLKINGQPF